MTSINFGGNWVTWVSEYGRKAEIFRLIRSGEKTSTIRRTPHQGKAWQLYYGMRTKNCELIAEVVPKGIYKIELGPDKRLIKVFENGCWSSLLTHKTIEADGFYLHETAFWEYFKEGGIWYLHVWEKPVERKVLGWRLPRRLKEEDLSEVIRSIPERFIEAATRK